MIYRAGFLVLMDIDHDGTMARAGSAAGALFLFKNHVRFSEQFQKVTRFELRRIMSHGSHGADHAPGSGLINISKNYRQNRGDQNHADEYLPNNGQTPPGQQDLHGKTTKQKG